ncbi:MAG: spore cortex biosynthesis protein YabQ [Clostridia bacterium]|nr:spore cortex biosynthesis protein YabQ [Clostridia bacterium]
MSPYAVFLVCSACGVCSGIVYDLLYILRNLLFGRYTRMGKIAAGICDAVYFAVLSVMYVFCSVYFGFPDLRLYMVAAVLCGIILYLKSFHKSIAFLVKKIYNRNVKR